MTLGINVLDVCHHEVAGIEDATKRREGRLLAGERSEGGVEAGVDATGVGGLEELGHEFGLGESLAAGDGDAAFGTPVAPVALGAVKELVDAHEGATLGTPGIRVVAEAAAHGATLKEDEETNARAVSRAERLRRVNPALHDASSLFLPRQVAMARADGHLAHHPINEKNVIRWIEVFLD